MDDSTTRKYFYVGETERSFWQRLHEEHLNPEYRAKYPDKYMYRVMKNLQERDTVHVRVLYTRKAGDLPTIVYPNVWQDEISHVAHYRLCAFCKTHFMLMIVFWF